MSVVIKVSYTDRRYFVSFDLTYKIHYLSLGTPQWKCRRCTYLNDYNLTACFMCEEPRHPEDEVSNPVASTTSPPPPPPPPPRPPRPLRSNTSNEYWATHSERPYYIPPAPPSSSCVPLTPSSAPLTPNSVPTTPNNVPLTSSSSSESVGFNHANRRVFFPQQSMSENSFQRHHSIRPSNYARSNSSASYTFGSDYQRANSFNENR